MPKTHTISKRRYNYRRRQYVPQGLRMPTIRRPLASKYGDEVYLKVQQVVPLTT